MSLPFSPCTVLMTSSLLVTLEGSGSRGKVSCLLICVANVLTPFHLSLSLSPLCICIITLLSVIRTWRWVGGGVNAVKKECRKRENGLLKGSSWRGEGISYRGIR